jgi:hypothetical protein
MLYILLDYKHVYHHFNIKIKRREALSPLGKSTELLFIWYL